MDAMTLFMVLLLGMATPIVAIAIAVIVDLVVVAWMAIHEVHWVPGVFGSHA
jgi:hypothetical protein